MLVARPQLAITPTQARHKIGLGDLALPHQKNPITFFHLPPTPSTNHPTMPEEDRTEEALEALVLITGKLELIIARGPQQSSVCRQLSDIEKKTSSGQSGTGFFDKIRNALSKLWS